MGKDKIILVSNDDGIRSEGIVKLVGALKGLGRVFVVAPDREQSAASHSLTLHRPLRVEEIEENHYAVDGTPTDCVTLACGVKGFLPGKPDIVVSGINKGGNLGEDTLYSGTVSAAMEGTVLEIPSIAVSLVGRDNFDFKAAASFTAKLTEKVLGGSFPKDTLLNVNVPSVDVIKGCRVTHLGKRVFGEGITERIDPRGKKYYWIGGDIERWEGGEDSDFKAIEDGFISITPLHLDLTSYPTIDSLRSLEELGKDIA